jgi:hypothetical protein
VRQSKANLHTHSTQSDGSLTVPVVIDSYHALGYEVLAMTDHNKVTWPWSSHGRDWDGMMDDSGIWGRALDASEVFALYNLGQTGQALTTAITTHVKADNTTALSLGGPWDTGNPPATADFLVFNSDFAQAGALDTGAPMAGAGLRVSGGSGLIDTNNPSGVLTLGNLGQPIR